MYTDIYFFTETKYDFSVFQIIGIYDIFEYEKEWKRESKTKMSQTELKNEFARYTRDRSLFLAFPFLRLSPVTPDNSSIHSSSLLPRLSLSLSFSRIRALSFEKHRGGT